MKIRKIRKFSELTNGDLFMFPGDRRSTIKKTGFVKVGDKEYMNISAFNESSSRAPKFHAASDTEVLFFPVASIQNIANKSA